MNTLTEGAITIALMIGGIALASVLVSRNANTAGVIQAGASAFGNDIAVAQSPVTGNMPSINLSYPAENSVFGS
jgi:PRD1 phage membrane DNA delivery